MNYQLSEYRNRVLGCFIGKNAGGTLGMRDEWHRRINKVDFYVHEITGEPLPNDDMDIQLVWLVALEEQGVRIDSKILGDYWMYYVTPHWAEYGKCKVNMRCGLQPPFSGTINNPYKDSCGAYIRSEIWACLAPACPEIAVKYAYEDALIDHGEGEGLYAEIFCAAIQSAAFVESDIRALIQIGLSYIPPQCDIANVIRLVETLYDSGKSWVEARDEVLRNYLGGFIFTVSEEDQAKGFINGRVGWEAPSNIGLIVLALLYGERDFEKTICIAVNCGEDTDCTAATAGALLGIILGATNIPEKWVVPIGTNLKTACLNLGELGNLGNILPKNIYELQTRIEKIVPQIFSYHRADMILNDEVSVVNKNFICKEYDNLYIGKHTTRYHFDFFDIDVRYENSPVVTNESKKRVEFTVHNRYKTPENFHVHVYMENKEICIKNTGMLHVPEGVWLHNKNSISFNFEFNIIQTGCCRGVAQFTTPSHSGVMLVPLYFYHDENVVID